MPTDKRVTPTVPVHVRDWLLERSRYHKVPMARVAVALCRMYGVLDMPAMKNQRVTLGFNDNTWTSLCELFGHKPTNEAMRFVLSHYSERWDKTGDELLGEALRPQGDEK